MGFLEALFGGGGIRYKKISDLREVDARIWLNEIPPVEVKVIVEERPLGRRERQLQGMHKKEKYTSPSITEERWEVNPDRPGGWLNDPDHLRAMPNYRGCTGGGPDLERKISGMDREELEKCAQQTYGPGFYTEAARLAANRINYEDTHDRFG